MTTKDSVHAGRAKGAPSSDEAARAVASQGDPVHALRAAVSGRVIAPDDADYDAARTIFYGGIDRRPAAIVRVANATDVAQVISIARASRAQLAVRSGGHSIPGHSVSEGGIVIDLGDMKAMEVDVERRTAWADSGLTAAEYTARAGAHGLATGFGDTGSVGIGGITLGGGIGFLVRKYGLTIDDLLAAEIVTADGQIRTIDAATEPDLFWAIRGGGGNFGVVTRFQFRLHEVSTVIGGMLIVPASTGLLRAFIRLAEVAPEELSTIFNVLKAPPMPFLPAQYHGTLIMMAQLVYAGDVDAGQRAVAPFRALATPIADMLRPMPYPEIYPPDPEGFHPVLAVRNLFLDAFAGRDADMVFAHLRESTSSMPATQIRVLGGAMARVPVEATAFAHRTRRYMVNIAALHQSPDETVIHETWVEQIAARLQQGDGGAYVNFLSSEGAMRVREAYPGATWDRLAAIKARYDPTNFFRLNQNIPPGSAS